METYKLTIGIEVHAELTTKSKMFCGCKNDPHTSKPNQNTCPVCLAHPGTLPVVNKEAVRKLLMVGSAVAGEIASFTEFDRKNYFYPDIPKAYQLSQYAFPFVKGGELAGVELTRIHLEEDTARSLHDQSEGSCVDFNRAGVPLMELVTEPVIHDAAAAATFTRELQLLLRTIGVSQANMEKGEMRVEANISISKTDELGTKVEVKNLNSHRAMEAAILYELKRQAEILDSGGEVVQETRGWDENKSKTFSQRTKEGAADYRYFPDPDIPKMDISKVLEFKNSRIAESIPETPTKKRLFYANLGLPSDQIELIIAQKTLEHFFGKLVRLDTSSPELAQLSANYITSDIVKLLADNPERSLETVNPTGLCMLMQMVCDDEINSRVAKDLLPEVLFEAADPKKMATERGLLQMSSDDDLLPLIEQIIAENSEVVAEYRAGKDSALKFLIGQAMKLSKGSANPAKVADLLTKTISS